MPSLISILHHCFNKNAIAVADIESRQLKAKVEILKMELNKIKENYFEKYKGRILEIMKGDVQDATY